jgi:hypothetical protein
MREDSLLTRSTIKGKPENVNVLIGSESLPVTAHATLELLRAYNYVQDDEDLLISSRLPSDITTCLINPLAL